MDANKINFDKASTGVEDRFRFLPDEVLLFIFNKLADLNNLCRCSMVSKRFDSVISEIRAVSIILPRKEASIFKSPNAESLLELKLPNFLEKLSCLESVFCEYTSPRNVDDSSLLKWKIINRTNEDFPSLVAILPVSVHKKSEFVPNQEMWTLGNSRDNLIESLLNSCYSSALGYYAESLTLVQVLIKLHPTLRCVTIADSRKQGKLVIKDEQLIKIRSYLLDTKQELRTPSSLKMGWIPELHLPLSGYIMRGVWLVILKVPKESNVMEDNRDVEEEDNDIIAWDFDEEEKVFGEAIKEIFGKHRDIIMTAR